MSLALVQSCRALIANDDIGQEQRYPSFIVSSKPILIQRKAVVFHGQYASVNLA